MLAMNEEIKNSFRNLKTDISNCYRGLKYKWLRFCLHDLVAGGQLNETDIGAHLFNALELTGDISPTDIVILSEIANLTDVKEAKLIIDHYQEKNKLEKIGKERLTLHRKALFKTLRNVGESELKNVIANYIELVDVYTNVWDLVFFLEQQLLLESRAEKIERFLKLLNPETKRIYEGGVFPVGTISTTTVPMSIKGEVFPACPISTTTVSMSIKDEVSQSEPQFFFKEVVRADVFQIMLQEISNWWKEFGNINMLKVLMCDFDLDHEQIVGAEYAVDLFNLLQGCDLINQSNIDVLLEAAKLCNKKGVKYVIAKHIPEFMGSVFDSITFRTFSKFRHQLIKFGNSLTKQATYELAKSFRVTMYYDEDQWILIYRLEQADILIDDAAKRRRFIDNLNKIGLKKQARLLED